MKNIIPLLIIVLVFTVNPVAAQTVEQPVMHAIARMYSLQGDDGHCG